MPCDSEFIVALLHLHCNQCLGIRYWVFTQEVRVIHNEGMPNDRDVHMEKQAIEVWTFQQNCVRETARDSSTGVTGHPEVEPLGPGTALVGPALILTDPWRTVPILIRSTQQ
jgi:hypothetical protein